MKFLNKIFLILVIIGSVSIEANFYGTVNFFQRASFHLTGVLRPTRSLMAGLVKSYQIESFPDAGPEVFDFCKTRCEKQNFDAQGLKVKIDEKDAGIIEVVGRQSIVFSATNYNELQNALKNPDNAYSSQIILIYTFLVDHEIAHIKENDFIKSAAFLVGTNLLVYAGSYYVMKHSPLKTLFETPTNVKELITSSLAFNCIQPLFLANDYIYSLYAQGQETAADNNAIKFADNPESLRLAALYFEKLDEDYIDLLCGTKEPNPGLSWGVRVQIANIRKNLEAQYTSQKNSEDFRTWVEKQSDHLAFLKFVVDREHPSGFVRAQALRAAADELEAAQLGSDAGELVRLN